MWITHILKVPRLVRDTCNLFLSFAYNGYFAADSLLPNIIKDIFFDGTFYHLWYLPASIIGAVIAWFTVKQMGFRTALLITSALYIVGLFGDSYYGISKLIPPLKGMYGYLYEVSDYTRNGIFFAPVFFVLGGSIADKSFRISRKNSRIGFGVSLLLMSGEGMLLHHSGLQRHDIMYIFLLPCMFFLFHTLTYWRGKRNVLLRTSALVIYIIHPMVIVVIRMTAKILHMQKLLIDNSIIHYVLVSIPSAIAAVLGTLVYYKARKNHTAPHNAKKERAWVEINLDNLRHNVSAFKKAMPKGCDLMAVVKAGAYGHGAYEISTCLNQIGVKAFAAATIDEGIKLRRYGVNGKILILGFTAPARAKELNKYDLMQTLVDYNYARQLNRQGYDIEAHIKIDTGMHRLGFDCTDSEAVARACSMEYLEISGIFTHLCVSDSLAADNVSFTEMQIQRFYKLTDSLKESGIKIPKIHMQSSYGFLNYPELKCSYVRAGIALYGVLSSPDDTTRLQLDLRPVLSLKSQIVLLRRIKCGESVGYGRSFFAEKDSLIAILSIGYADGLPRNLSCGIGQVLIHGQRAPVVGRICMDQLAVDVTDIDPVSAGDVVTLIGRDGSDELPAAGIADHADTISNEILCKMGSRLKVV